MDLPQEPLRELALFAGAGGGLLGSRLLGWRTVCAVEIDPYRQAVLLARQADGCLNPFPIWDDVRTFDGRPWRGCVDIVTGGFPCQPFSVAGKRRGADDERNGWPDTIRIIREVGPRFALLENVPGLLTHEYARTIFGDLAEAGYDAEWDCVPASSIGARIIRERLFIFAAPRAVYEPNGINSGSKHRSQRPCWRWDENDSVRPSDSRGAWSREPELARVAYGVADRVDRLAAIGDGQVPAVVEAAWKILNPDLTTRET